MNEVSTANSSWRMLIKERHLSRLLLLCFGVWLYAADSTLVATILPVSIEDIGGIPLLSWAYTLYQLGSVLTGAIAGLMVIRLGIAKSQMIVCSLYIMGCIISAYAYDMHTMVFGRLLQGMGGGGLVSLAFIGGSTIFPKKFWLRIIAVISGFWGVSSLCGPLIGGFFVYIGNWRGAFLLFAAQGLVAIILARILLNRLAQNKKTTVQQAIPFSRLSLLGISVLLICQAGVIKNIFFSIIVCMTGFSLLLFFLKKDTESENRIFPRAIFNLNSNSGSGLIMITSLFMGTISFTVYGPLLMYIIFGVSPLIAGYIIALQSIGWTILAIITSGVRKNFEFVLIRMGAIFVCISLLGLTLVMQSGPLWTIGLLSISMGMGFGMSWSFVSKRIIASVPQNERVQASGSIPTFMRLAMALGSALSGIIANYSGFSEASSILVARNVAFWSFASFLPLIFVGLFFAWRLSR